MCHQKKKGKQADHHPVPFFGPLIPQIRRQLVSFSSCLPSSSSSSLLLHTLPIIFSSCTPLHCPSTVQCSAAANIFTCNTHRNSQTFPQLTRENYPIFIRTAFRCFRFPRVTTKTHFGSFAAFWGEFFLGNHSTGLLSFVYGSAFISRSRTFCSSQ